MQCLRHLVRRPDLNQSILQTRQFISCNTAYHIIQEGFTMILRDQYRQNRRAVLVLPALVLSLLLAEPAVAQKPASKPSANDGNLERCLEGLPSCDVSRLKPEDIGQISAVRRTRNVQNCRSGSPNCDPTSLQPKELQEAVSATKGRNLER